MKEVRLGVIGVGGMGTNHAQNVEAGKVRGMRLTAVCDVNPRQLAKFNDTIKKFTDHRKLLKSGEVFETLSHLKDYGLSTTTRTRPSASTRSRPACMCWWRSPSPCTRRTASG